MAEKSELIYLASCIFLLPAVMPKRGLFSLKRNGSIEFYFGYLDEAKYSDISETHIALRNELISAVEKTFDIQFTEKQKHGFPSLPPDKWHAGLHAFSVALQSIADKYAGS